MKRIVVLFYAAYLLFNPAFAQNPGEWVWVHGSNSPNSAGFYGIQGIPSPANQPAGVYEPSEWTDLNGNFWLFGGYGYTNGNYGDLWKYDPLTNEWTWMTGTNTVNDPGSYGSQGVSSPTNRPPARGWGVASWTDLNGNLWMYGGDETSSMGFGDLWKYNIGTNEWTWMKGANSLGASSIYGTQGVASSSNNPGSHFEVSAAWTDNAGDIWLLGGINYTIKSFNSLWRYNINSNMWTWMKGSNQTNQPATFGTKGVESSANNPAGRTAYCRWKDKDGNLWTFGGDGNGSIRNDLWRFNPVTNNWTWMNGDSIGSIPGVFGAKCVTSPLNKPGGRYENRVSWTDADGNFWMFGGTVSGGQVNDLWKYCVADYEWTWISGDSILNPSANWGTLGVSSPTNKPDGRRGAVGWTDGKGHLYMFGGNVIPYLKTINDLWKFTIDTTCGRCATAILPPVASFRASDTVLCANDCINFSDRSTNATSWQWSFLGGTPSYSTDQNPQDICYLSSGVYNVKLVVSNSGGSDSITFNSYINVKTAPPTPVITQAGATIYCSTDPSYTSYQWFDSTTLISGATDTSLVITHGGNYNVQVTNENGCKIAVGINIILGVASSKDESAIRIFPNPAISHLTLYLSPLTVNKAVSVLIINVLGEQVYTQQLQTSGLEPQIVVDISGFSKGLYIAQIIDDYKIYRIKFIKD